MCLLHSEKLVAGSVLFRIYNPSGAKKQTKKNPCTLLHACYGDYVWA